jgi:pimeloyl-ACP methyl ester carboxylesterase
VELRQGSVTANDVTFAYLEVGDGPLALCLHGFPDSARTWRYLLPALAEAGFRAVAPWMRGYAPTSLAPDGCYQSGALAADAIALHEALGGDADAVLIGHDWGALAAYGAAAHEPARWRRVVTMAVPPPGAMGDAFFRYDQIKRSFYIFFFQTPFAEMAVAHDDLAFIEGLWRDWSPGYDGRDDIAWVKESLRNPDNLAAAIGYYRAMFDPSRHQERYAAIQAAAGQAPPQPTLYLHGSTDGCLGVELAAGAGSALGPGSKAVVVEGAGHFLHVEKPDEINRLVCDWVRG